MKRSSARKLRGLGFFAVVLAVCIAGSVLAAWLIYGGKPGGPTDNIINNTPTPAVTSPGNATQAPNTTPTPQGEKTVKLKAVGDIMLHGPILNAAKQTDGKYSFSGFFDDIKSYLEADLLIGNLETPINTAVQPSGYPNFNAPESLLTELKAVGFDVLTTANNHAFDQKRAGLISTLDALDRSGIKHTGTYRSAEEYANRYLIQEVNGIKIGILAYTDIENNAHYIYDEFLPTIISRIDYNSPNKIKTDINKLRELGAEVVVLSLHWGPEYAQIPADRQRDLAQSVMDAGADIILGSHSHRVQEMKRKTVTAGGAQKDSFIAYSMGNFFCDQRDMTNPPPLKFTETGYIVNIEIKKLSDGTIKINDSSYTPFWLYRYKENNVNHYRTLPMGKYAKATAKPEDISEAAWTELKSQWQTVQNLAKDEGKTKMIAD